MLDKLNEYPELQKDYFVVLKSNLREQLGNVNTSALDALEQSEHHETFVAYTTRKAYEKETRDPDDCYLEVLKREEELQSEGQPSRIGILLGMQPMTREEILNGSFAAASEGDEGDQNGDEEDNDATSE